MGQATHGVGHQTLTDRTLRGLIGTVDDMIVSQQAEFRSDGQRLSGFRPILPPGTAGGFSGVGGMTFTVTPDPANGLITYRYLMLTEELMFVDVMVRGIIGGTVSTIALLPLPVGYQIAGTQSRVLCEILNPATSVGLMVLDPVSPTHIRVYKTLDAGTNFVPGDLYVFGQVMVNVVPLS